MEKINSKIFKAYDIRGLYPEEINEEAVYRISRAFVEFLNNQGEFGNRRFIVGHDARLSSEDLSEAVIQGLVNSSCDIIDIGLVSTPLFYWAIINKKAAGGIMITASHNTASYNGLKICKQDARSIGFENGLFKIRDLAAKNNSVAVMQSAGKITKENLLFEYINFVKSKADLGIIKPMNVVVDCANGVMGPEIIELFKSLPCQASLLFGEPDGNFPNHEPNPLKEENTVALKERILSEKADFGVAFDGDGDRIAFLDEKGETVRGDFITALIGRELLKADPGEKIFYEVRSSHIVPEMILQAGGLPILGRHGHALIKEQMRREDILFGGELSGHYFFRSEGFVENSLLAMLKIFEIISREGKSFSEIVEPLKKYYDSGEINFEVAGADDKLTRIENHYHDAQIKKIDGITVEYNDWWFNIYKSNTEPLVRLNIEANSQELLDEKKKELIKLING